MTVFIIANTYWNIINFRQPIIEMLEKKGAKVYTCAPFDVSSDQTQNRSPNFIGLMHAHSHKNGLINAYKSIKEYKLIFNIKRPSLILLYTMKPNIYANIAAAQLGIPVISTVTGLGYTFIKGGLTRYISERLYKFAFRKTKYIVFHNPDDKQLFVNQGFAKENRCKVIRGSGVDIEKFKPQIESKKSDKFIFIFIGRLLVDKGFREYISAARNFIDKEDVEFHIVGERYPQNPASLTEKEWNEKSKARNITWHKKQEDVRPYIAEADVMVLPSYREGLPMSILEAMAMGKPVITTDVPGCRETIEAGINGLLVPVKDSEALTNAMQKMYSMPKTELKLWRQRSREKAIEEFSSRIVARAYEKLIFSENV